MNLICTRENGRMIQKKTLFKVLKQSGLNAASFRHTHAAMLEKNGANPFGISARLGLPNTNIYIHNTEKMQENIQKNIISVLEKIFSKKS